MKKIIAIAVCVLIGAVSIFLLYHLCDNVKSDDMDGIKKDLEENVLLHFRDIELECDEPAFSSDRKIMAVQVSGDCDGYDGFCACYIQDDIFKSRYKFQGGTTMTAGKIVADSEVFDECEYIFIRGFDVDSRYHEFDVPSLKINREIKDGRYLEVMETSRDYENAYDVKLLE